MINISTDNDGIVIYRKDKEYQGTTFPTYCIIVKNKDNAGNFKSCYIPVRFKKGTEVNNKAKIKINNAFPTFDAKRTGGEKYPFWFITDFDVLEQGEVNDAVENGYINIPTNIADQLPFV